MKIILINRIQMRLRQREFETKFNLELLKKMKYQLFEKINKELRTYSNDQILINLRNIIFFNIQQNI